MATIHHLFYPHIIDRVWAHMPLSSLPVAMAVSLEWEERSRQILRRHMIAWRHHSAPGVFNLTSLDFSEHSAPRQDFYVSVTPDDTSVLEFNDHPWREVIRDIRVLDLHVTTPSTAEDPAPEHDDLLDTLQVFRPGLTLRAFMADPPERFFGQGDTQVYFWVNNNPTQVVTVDPKLIVVNVSARIASHDFICRWLKRPRAGSTPIVLVLGAPSLRGISTSWSPKSIAAYLLQAARGMARFLSNSWTQNPVTLVGLEELLPREGEVAYEAFKRQLLAFLKESRSEEHPSDPMPPYGAWADRCLVLEGRKSESSSALGSFETPKACEQVRILTRREYEELVGAETYKLHTSWDHL